MEIDLKAEKLQTGPIMCSLSFAKFHDYILVDPTQFEEEVAQGLLTIVVGSNSQVKKMVFLFARRSIIQ